MMEVLLKHNSIYKLSSGVNGELWHKEHKEIMDADSCYNESEDQEPMPAQTTQSS